MGITRGGPFKESVLTDQQISSRFVFLDQPLKTTQIGPESFVDAYPAVAKPQFEVSKAGDTVRIQLTGQDTGYQSALAWPSPDAEPVELGPTMLQILETAPEGGGSEKTRALAQRIRDFLEPAGR